MKDDKKNIENNHKIILHYLEELSKIKLTNRSTLSRLHHKINTKHYSEAAVIKSISSSIIKDITLN